MGSGDEDVLDCRVEALVVKAKPEAAVLILETDCKVDFATPLNYVEQPPPKPVVPSAAQAENNNNEPVRFTGVAKRLDGKAVLEQPKPPPAAAPGGKTKYGLRFGGTDGGGMGKKGTEEGGSRLVAGTRLAMGISRVPTAHP